MDKCSSYKKLKHLGEGTYGVVTKVLGPDGKEYALKEFKPEDDGYGRGLLREVNILAQIKHPCVLSAEKLFADRCNVCCVLPLADSDLSRYIYDSFNIYGEITEPLHLFYQLACGIKELHVNDINYKDLKPQNCLIKKHENSLSGVKKL